MNMLAEFFLGTLLSYLQKKLLRPEVVAQLSYDLAKHVVKMTPMPEDDAFLDHVADYLELKK